MAIEDQIISLELENREAISRFYGPAQLDYISLFEFYYSLYKENIIKDVVRLHEKIDGYYFQFGIFEGDFFIKSSYSDVATEQNYKNVFYKSQEFINIFECLNSDKLLQKNLKLLYLKFGNFIYKSEILFANKNIEQKDFIQIGTIKYKKELFGDNGLIVIFDGFNFKNKKYVINKDLIIPSFLKSDKINFLYNKDFEFERQFEFYYEPLKEHFDDYKKSCLHIETDSIVGKLIKNDIDNCSKINQQRLDQMAEQHSGGLQYQNMPAEGLILAYKKRFFKGTTVAYQKNHEAARHFFDFLGRCRSQLDKIIEQASGDALKSEKKALIDLFLNKNEAFFDVIYQKNINLGLEKFANELFILKSKFFDFSKQFYSKKDEMSTNFYLKNVFEAKKVAFYLNLCIFDKQNISKIIIFYLKLENLIDYQKNDKEKADLWVGRAQPWHFGHHSMLEKERNIIIHFVAGKNDENNPLSGEDRYNFLSSIYKNNKNIYINPYYTDNAYLPFVFSALFAAPFEVDRILCGPDRFESYSEQLSQIDEDFFELTNGVRRSFKTIEVIKKDRLLSGTQVRYRAKATDYISFRESCYPEMNVDEQSLQEIYLKLRQNNEIIIKERQNSSQEKHQINKNDLPNKRKIRDIIII